MWTRSDIPNLAGKTAIVTGANSGIGFETAKTLAQFGATVIMACRNLEKGATAADEIRHMSITGTVEVIELDLADLESVADFASGFKQSYQALDLLINNAGIMVPPLGRTKQGFEQQFGVNHLAHFALTAQLAELLKVTPAARVVTVSSIAHNFGKIAFDDLQWRSRNYRPMAAYGQSKLANLLFAYELQRRFAAQEIDAISVAAHPGYAATNLTGKIPLSALFTRLTAQPQAAGALPTLRAATALDVVGGQYFGPNFLFETRGNPVVVQSNKASKDLEVAARLWQVSEELTGQSFPF